MTRSRYEDEGTRMAITAFFLKVILLRCPLSRMMHFSFTFRGNRAF